MLRCEGWQGGRVSRYGGGILSRDRGREGGRIVRGCILSGR
jgi:hypothetical protein